MLAWSFGASPLHPVLKITQEQKEWHRQQEKQDLTRTMAERLFTIGQEFLNEGLYAAAQKEFTEVLKLDPTNVKAQLGLLKSEVFTLFQGEYDPVVIDKRLQVMGKLIAEEIRPQDRTTEPGKTREDPHILVFKGDLSFILGEYETARKEYERAIESDANVSQAYFKLGWLYEQTGDLAKAVGMYEAAVSKSRLNRD